MRVFVYRAYVVFFAIAFCFGGTRSLAHAAEPLPALSLSGLHGEYSTDGLTVVWATYDQTTQTGDIYAARLSDSRPFLVAGGGAIDRFAPQVSGAIIIWIQIAVPQNAPAELHARNVTTGKETT